MTIGELRFINGQLKRWNGVVWVAVPMSSGSGGVSDGSKGDITVSGSGTSWTIPNGTVTAAKTSISGTPTGSKFLRDDFSWQPAAGSGTVTTPAVQTAVAQNGLMDYGAIVTATGDAAGTVGDLVGVHYTAEAEFNT